MITILKTLTGMNGNAIILLISAPTKLLKIVAPIKIIKINHIYKINIFFVNF